ncbi:MAG: YgjP-like metallopeptidase domain-containing protein, partial [Candidatus Woesearchaeota archaeon]
TNTISITKRLIVHEDLLDYVLFHEMCHKKALFYKTNQRTMHHTGFFREIENIYPNSDALERKLKMTRL